MQLQKIHLEIIILMLCLALVPLVQSYSNLYNVTMVLTFNVSGLSYSAYADNYTANGTYNSSNISQYYACINTSQNYTTGMVFTGSSFISEELINQTSLYSLKMTQAMAGNEFVIPIIPGNCDIIDSKLNVSRDYINGPFVQFLAEGAYMAVLSLSYSGVDFISPSGTDFSSEASLLLQKNETGNVTQIIMERR
jgi:hypothetical protein